MNKASRKCCVEAIRKRYHKTTRDEKATILDEFCHTCGYNRKYAIRILCKIPVDVSGTKKAPGIRKRAGRKKQYHTPTFVQFIRNVWRATNCVCSKRLVEALPLFAPYATPVLSNDEQLLASTVSSATLDRILAPYRRSAGKLGLATTKPGSLLKRHIPVKTNQWDESIPGFVEADTVAHGGSSASGTFAHTVNLVDIATGWTIQRATWGKGQRTCYDALYDIERVLPFRLRGFDSDNGSEFLNYHLYSYYADRKRPVEYTRSRPYYKNDNAHIEQKNWTMVRQYLGYMRFDHPDIVPMMNDLYSNELYLLSNFFLPSFKLTGKQRVGARVIKTYDHPKTPYQRLLESGILPIYKQQKLKRTMSSLNPFKLQQQIVLKVNRILRFAASPSATP